MSIDRIRNDDGYRPGNVRLVLVAVNIALGAWGDEVFYRIAENVRRPEHAARPVKPGA